MPKLSPSQSAEDYLERIHELIEQKGYARVVDIASSLKVKQASVTSMVQKLAEAGYRVRIYVPFGTHWARYFRRRMFERRENLTFALRSYVGRHR